MESKDKAKAEVKRKSKRGNAKVKTTENQEDLYPSTYVPYTTSSSIATIGTPTFTATMRLGDNSANPGGTTELILNGISGQIAWGTDDNGNLNSNANYSNGVKFTLSIPQTTNATTPAYLTVATAPVVQLTTSSTYTQITNVLVETVVNTQGTPADCVWAAISNLSITYFDAQNDPTTNPMPTTDPIATMGDACAMGDGDNLDAILATPVGWNPVRVQVAGVLQMVSSDAYYQNAGANLGLASVQVKILVYTS